MVTGTKKDAIMVSLGRIAREWQDFPGELWILTNN
jgi:hypothetical protein